MAEKDPNLEWNVDVSDLSSISLDDESLEDIDIENSMDGAINTESQWNTDTEVSTINSVDNMLEWSTNTISENVFLEGWDDDNIRTQVIDKWDSLWSYLRRIFFSWVLALLWVLVIVLIYSFDLYIKQASKATVDVNYASYVDTYKDKFWKLKDLIWINNINNYQSPKVWMQQSLNAVNNIINATDIDYIDKRDLLSNYVSSLAKDTQDKIVYTESLKEKIAKQWFLPVELETILSEDQSIDTIQRSLNALEVVKFSTAVKVFSYMNTALTTISEMIRMNSITVDNIKQLFNQINMRWEKDISSYVYMCYLNPFETNANCDVVGDLDLYYNLIKDDSLNIKLFKNAMNAISQLLENGDSTLFSITFNGFNAQQKNISFNIEVYTNQEDEKILLAKWQKNPNIFILTNIINLLKQSSFIIWAEINTKEINVDTRTVNWWSISKTVNYSSMDFTVPIQKDTEREIFDYIDSKSMKELLDIKLNRKNTTENNEEENMDNEIEGNEDAQEDVAQNEVSDDEALDNVEITTSDNVSQDAQ